MKRGDYWKRLGAPISKVGQSHVVPKASSHKLPDSWNKKPLQEKICKTDLDSAYTRIQLSMKKLPNDLEEAVWRSSIDVHNELLPYTRDIEGANRFPEADDLLPLPWLDPP
jgi:hypothetical protein